MKTQTAYIPLKEGDRIASGHYSARPEGLIKCGDGIIGERFNLNDYYQVFSTIEVPVSEPEVDPYAELKAAFAAGKVIQWRRQIDGEWIDHYRSDPLWSQWAIGDLRIKPEPVKVPLGPEDVPPGSAIRFKGYSRWSMVSHLETDGVFLTGGTEFCSFEKLMQEDREISRDNGKTWHPCWKEVAQ